MKYIFIKNPHICLDAGIASGIIAGAEWLISALTCAAPLLGIVLLPVDGPAGVPLILADVLALVARYHAIGLGGVLVLADIHLLGAHAGRFGAGELAAGYALANAGVLVALAGIDDWRSGLGLRDVRNGKQAQGSN